MIRASNVTHSELNNGVANKNAALCQAVGSDANQAFYNDSPFTRRDLANSKGKNVSVHLFGQEVNPETYATGILNMKSYAFWASFIFPQIYDLLQKWCVLKTV